MSQKKDGQQETVEQAELRKWIEGQFQNMARHVVENDLMSGDRAEGRPMWAMPNKLYIGKIWDKSDVDNCWWIISGAVKTDHLQASVAATPRDALRHFCLKWQLQTARLEKAADSDHQADRQDWTGIAENLTDQAETLYKLVEEDRLWENTADPAA